MIRRFLDWSTLTYSPSLMGAARGEAFVGVCDGPGMAYASAWWQRRERFARLPLLGRFFRAWDAAGDPHAEAAAEYARAVDEIFEE